MSAETGLAEPLPLWRDLLNYFGFGYVFRPRYSGEYEVVHKWKAAGAGPCGPRAAISPMWFFTLKTPDGDMDVSVTPFDYRTTAVGSKRRATYRVCRFTENLEGDLSR